MQIDQSSWEVTLNEFRNAYEHAKDQSERLLGTHHHILFCIIKEEGMDLKVKQVQALGLYFQDYPGEGRITADERSFENLIDEITRDEYAIYQLNFDKKGLSRIQQAMEKLTIEKACTLPIPEDSTTPSVRF